MLPLKRLLPAEMGRLLKPDRLFQVLLGPVEGGPYCIFCNVLSIISAVKWLRENASALTVRVVGSLITAVILYLCSLIPKLAPYLAYRLPVWLSLSILSKRQRKPSVPSMNLVMK